MIGMSLPLLLLVLSLATARLVRLVVADEIMKPVRVAAARRWGPAGRIPYLLHCPWCSGMWLSTALCVFSWITGLCSAPVAALLIPASAYGAAFIRSMIEE